MARYQVPDEILNALIRQESGGNNNAISKKGARGITQVMPATAKDPGFGSFSKDKGLRGEAEISGLTEKRR